MEKAAKLAPTLIHPGHRISSRLSIGLLALCVSQLLQVGKNPICGRPEQGQPCRCEFYVHGRERVCKESKGAIRGDQAAVPHFARCSGRLRA